VARKLKDVVLELADDEQRRQEFQQDPAGYAAAAGLSPQHQSVLASQDEDQIRKAVAKESGAADDAMPIVMI
jgi:hypothetical protein